MTAAAPNPFAPPKVNVEQPLTGSEQMRQEHLHHEASVKSISWLYGLGVMSISLVMFAILRINRTGNDLSVFGIAAVLGIALAVSAYVTVYIRRFSRNARIAATVLSVIGLLGFPMGTLLNGYILYLLWCAKGKVVFSDRYQEVIAQTPHLKPGISRLFLIILIVFAIVIAGVVAAIVIPAVQGGK
jgi:hypothetical protein